MIQRYDVMYAKDSNGKTFWNKCGVAFLSKNGSGYNLLLDAIPAPQEGSYKLFLFEPKDNSSKDSSPPNSSSRPTAKLDTASLDDDIPF